MVTALSMMGLLLGGTRPFELMPLNALAAIVIAGVVPLVDFGSLLPLLKVCDPAQHCIPILGSISWKHSCDAQARQCWVEMCIVLQHIWYNIDCWPF